MIQYGFLGRFLIFILFYLFSLLFLSHNFFLVCILWSGWHRLSQTLLLSLEISLLRCI